jgi:hypothetical protein
MGTMVNPFTPDSPKTRLETLLFKHTQRFLQNVLGGLLPWATANTNNNHNSSNQNTHLYTLTFSNKPVFHISMLVKEG